MDNKPIYFLKEMSFYGLTPLRKARKEEEGVQLQHRAPTPFSPNSFFINNSSLFTKRGYFDGFYRWGLDTGIPPAFIFPPILSSRQDQRGSLLLQCDSKNLLNLQSNLPSDIIREGVSSAKDENVLTSEILLPETVYDYSGFNPALPEGCYYTLQYLFPLSKNQVPVSSFCKAQEGFYNSVLITRPYAGGERICLCTEGDFGEYKPPVELKLSLEKAFRSSFSTKRINVGNSRLPSSSKKVQDQALFPRPVEECECYPYFGLLTQRDMKDMCSYAYKDNQFDLFSCGTDHVVSGEIAGGVVLAAYLESEELLSEDMFSNITPVVFDTITIAYYVTLASLYSPEDEEGFKRYAVCTSPIRFAALPSTSSVPIDVSNKMYKVFPEGNCSAFCRPFAVTYCPYHLKASEEIPSYVKYLPSKDGEMIDVQEENVRVYTQVKILISFMFKSYAQSVVSDTYKNKVRIAMGTPSLQGDLLSPLDSGIDLQCQLCTMQDGFIKDYPDKAAGYSHLFNEFCKAGYISCTPNDFKASAVREGRVRAPQSGRPRQFVLLESAEATCCRLSE